MERKKSGSNKRRRNLELEIAEVLSHSQSVASATVNLSDYIRRRGEHFATALFPTMNANFPHTVKLSIYDDLVRWATFLMELPDLVKLVVKESDPNIAPIIVRVWVNSVVEVLRNWDDLMEGIIGVAETIVNPQKFVGTVVQAAGGSDKAAEGKENQGANGSTGLGKTAFRR